jgi:predicted negative regulator of RcsB-dependent stress response
VSEHLTEEEQIENLKRLWKEYGSTIIVSVLVATGGYFSWNFWQDQQQLKAENASTLYEQLTNAANANESGKVFELSDKIYNTDSDSVYAAQAALYAAQAAVNDNDLDTAQGQLERVLDNSDDPAMQALARLRLARVLAAAGDYDQALLLLADQPAAGFSPEQAEVRGDILRQSGATDAALTAYQSAIDGVSPEQQQRRMLLQMKIDNLKPATGAAEPSA